MVRIYHESPLLPQGEVPATREMRVSMQSAVPYLLDYALHRSPHLSLRDIFSQWEKKR
jgi:hypothetical protein